jgi:hypothetical protein
MMGTLLYALSVRERGKQVPVSINVTVQQKPRASNP